MTARDGVPPHADGSEEPHVDLPDDGFRRGGRSGRYEKRTGRARRNQRQQSVARQHRQKHGLAERRHHGVSATRRHREERSGHHGRDEQICYLQPRALRHLRTGHAEFFIHEVQPLLEAKVRMAREWARRPVRQWKGEQEPPVPQVDATTGGNQRRGKSDEGTGRR